MDQVPHIAVVDDHREIRDLVGQYLRTQGYRVSLAEGGTALRRILETGAPDLVVLDIMMPGEDGLTLCRAIQARPGADIPIIFLTARGEETDRVIGLELGADDYLVKPFSSRELLARIKAVLRRAHALPPRSGARRTGALRFDRWVFDLSRRELQGDDGVGLPLSNAEYRLLKVFTEHPGIVLSRDQLLDMTVGREAEPFDRSIDNQISRLRRKVERDPRNPILIQTHRGGGYSFIPEVHAV
ncbi:MAG: response regulator [Rhodobacteraceae bacterium]|nr:response regulator [Paracoccaceae bacterium]MBR9820680.1 response regulator [Paracoccaceae bacterium]